MGTTKHLVVGIAGLEDRVNGLIPKRYGSWKILSERGTGRLLNKREVRKVIKECRDKGYEVIPTCDNIDEKGYCKGHPVIENNLPISSQRAEGK